MKQFAVLILICTGLSLSAQVNPLDPTFGNNGQVNVAGFFPGADLEIQPDGKILSVGAMDSVTVINSNYFHLTQTVTVVRFNSDGTLDNSFGINGLAAVGIDSILYPNYTNTFESSGHDLYIQDDNKILVIGSMKGNLSLGTLVIAFALRLNSTGTIDTSFGQNGVVKLNTNQGGLYEGYAIRQLSSGKIACGGKTHGLGIMRLESNGDRDTTFGNNGVADSTGVFNISNNIEFLIEDGNNIIGIGGNTDPDNYSLYRIRVNSGGIIDTLYSNGPIPMQGVFGGISTNGVAIAGDSSVFVAGFCFQNGQKGIVYKLKSNGAVDSTFGTNGYYVNVNVSNFGGVFIDSDGQLLVPGIYFNSVNFSLHRITSTGQLDDTFGDGLGYYVSNLPSIGTSITQFAAMASAIQVDGKILITTHKLYAQNNQQYIARFFPSNIISVNETTVSTDYTIYPNPAQAGSVLTFSAKDKITAINVFDLQGRLISNTTGNSITAPAIAGMYVVQMIYPGGISNQKLVVN